MPAEQEPQRDDLIFNPLTDNELRAICLLLIDDVNHALPLLLPGIFCTVYLYM